jgi:WD40 repeat protein
LHVLSGEFDIRPAFSRDGRLLALPLDSEVEIRDVRTLDLQNTVECVREVVSVDFHPHDNSLISDLCVDGTMEEWNISADRYSRYETHRGYYRETKPFPDKVSYNADGTRIIYCSEGFRAILVRSTEEFSHSLMEITMPAMKFKTFALDSDGRHVDALFVSEDEPAVMKRWNIVTGDEVKSLRIATDEIYCTVFSKNNTVLITGHQNKICVWTLDDDTSSLSTTINGDWRVTAIDVTRSGDVIASGGDDGVIRLFDASSGDPLAVYRGHTQPITSVVFSPQEDRLVSTSRDETVRIWDTRKEAWSLSSSGSMRHVVFSPNGRIIAASARNDIIISDGRDGSVLCTFTGHTDSVRSLAFSPDNTLLASFSRTDGVFLWSIGTKGSLPRLLSNSNTIDTDSSWIVFSAYGTQLAIVNETFMDESVTFSFQVRIWDVPNSNGVDSAEPGNELFHSNSHDGRSPHLLRLSSNESLTFVRHLEPDENDKVIVWDRITDAMEEHDYDQDSHSSLKPVFVEDRGWVVSARTGRQLFWLPESRRPSCRDSVATRGNLIAIGSSTGVLSLLDMSPLGGL